MTLTFLKPKPLLFCASLVLKISIILGQSPASYVNPFIGTSNYGATHPGSQYPHAMLSIAPFNVAHKKDSGNVHEKDSEWNSRVYIHENSYLTGYSHVNLSGVGCPDLGSIITMPTTGELDFDSKTYGSTYSNEKAEPGYYTHHLDRYKTDVEVTSSLRSGISRYTFPKGESNILINLGLGLTNETGGFLRIVSNKEVEGFKTIGTFCYSSEDVRPVYFVAKLSKAPNAFGAWKKMPKYYAVEGDWVKYNDQYKPYPNYTQEMAGDDIGAYFSFETEENEVVQIKIGISYVSIDNARENLNSEIPDFNFNEVKNKSFNEWDDLLGRIRLEGNEGDKTLFYSALYHTLIHPNIFQDVNGDYPLMGSGGVGNTSGKNRYTVFSLWDTYRNVHPFLSLVYPELQSEMVKTMISMYKENGWLPKWELLGMETDVMVGDPAVPVITDTYLRGIRDFDIESAYDAIKKSGNAASNNPLRPGHEAYLTYGYVPVDKEDQWGGSVSTSLEYYISDWNISMLAKELGYKKDHKEYMKRAMGYEKLFNAETGMLRPKHADGRWFEPYDPLKGKNFEPATGYVEGCAWNYRFYVPHDIPGLIKMNGGNSQFIEQLDQTFTHDHYDMANEPDITYPFLFNYVEGSEWRTQKRVRELVDKYYHNSPGGIPGNDDTGALSTWLLYAMMGFYPVCPGDMDYALYTPIFDKITISLNPDYYDGKELILEKDKETEGDLIKRIRWNNQTHDSYFISHQKLTAGGSLLFQLKENEGDD